ncbi:MarR family winged helix-turn-helix transcriptional regulator [Sphingomonas panacisoli]|uniref:MarR family winged helix-turn-helix transcriptional regulator n=1 Tax=Sphingomonas panacisoli TaxID=1813879 RepID=UPI001961D065|nr:MarR family transcriptional regulator [Sphingomonas panacisoli]
MSALASVATDDHARLRLWLRLLRTTRAIERQLRERLADAFDTTLPRFDVMAALDRAPEGMMMGELSRFLLVSNGNVTGIVERLVSDGLIARGHRDGDRRAAIVRLTPAGRTQFATMAAAHARWIDELLAPIDPATAQDITATLTAFRSQWEKEA